MSRAAALERTIRRRGRSVTVTHVETGTYDVATGMVPVTETPATVKAGVRPMETLDGDRQARSIKATVPAGALPFNPCAGDRITYRFRTYRIYSAELVFDGEDPAAWIIEAAR